MARPKVTRSLSRVVESQFGYRWQRCIHAHGHGFKLHLLLYRPMERKRPRNDLCLEHQPAGRYS